MYFKGNARVRNITTEWVTFDSKVICYSVVSCWIQWSPIPNHFDSQYGAKSATPGAFCRTARPRLIPSFILTFALQYVLHLGKPKGQGANERTREDLPGRTMKFSLIFHPPERPRILIYLLFLPQPLSLDSLRAVCGPSLNPVLLLSTSLSSSQYCGPSIPPTTLFLPP